MATLLLHVSLEVTPSHGTISLAQVLVLSGSVELQIGEMTFRFQTDSRTAGSMAQ